MVIARRLHALDVIKEVKPLLPFPAVGALVFWNTKQAAVEKLN
jgi:hypothetical protein